MEEIEVQMTPVRSTLRTFGKCATYDLDSEKNKLIKIKITSPMEILVLLHDKHQQNLHRELSLFYKLTGIILDWFRKLIFVIEGHHYFLLTTSKSSALTRGSRPCYDGEDYGDQEYLKLVQIVEEKFGCMSPFIPRKYRPGLGLCRNQTTARILNQFLKRSVALTGISANLWSSDYYFMPPCTTFKYNIDIISEHVRCKF